MIEVRLLGPLELLVDGVAVEIPRGRMRTLVAVLALSAGQPVSLGVLLDRIWGGEPPSTGRQVVQNNIWRLRRLLGSEVVATAGDGYLLRVVPEHVDALRFTRLLDAARRGADETYQMLGEALQLWRGEPLGGVSGGWERDQAAALTELYLAGVERRIDLDLAAGRHADVIVELQRQTAEQPLRETLWARLLMALTGCGRQAEALEAYEQVRSQLADGLGADPSTELRELHRRILRGEPLDELVRAAPDPTPAASAGSARSSAVATKPRQLPTAVWDFVGRGDHVAVLDAMLTEHLDRASGEGRPVVIAALHGPGGAGKTALAVHWAHQVSSRFPDGQLYLNLQGYGPQPPIPPNVALGTLLRSLGTPADAIPTGLAEATALLRSTLSGRQVLILLDNARDSEQVRPLLPGSGCLVLVTSRNQLQGLSVREGARRLVLAELPEPDARVLLETGIGPTRAATESTAVGELAQLCGRLPLALRIAAQLAAQFPEATLAQLTDGLRDRQGRLDVLADTDDATADVRAVFSWSYQALEPELARAFRLIALYPGPDVSLPPAAALFGATEPQARRWLAALTAVHLVEQRHPGRYQMHDLLRAYAAEHTAEHSVEAERALERMLTWYVHTAGNAEAGFAPDSRREPLSIGDLDALAIAPMTFPDSTGATSWLSGERASLIAAFDLAASRHLDGYAWRIARSLITYLDARGDNREMHAVAIRGVESARRLGDPLGSYHMEALLGRALVNAEHFRDGIKQYQRALGAARELDDHVKIAAILSILGGYSSKVGDHAGGIRYCQEAVAMVPDGNRIQLAQCLHNLGAAYSNSGDHERGLRYWKDALTLCEEIGNRLWQGWALYAMALGHERAGQHAAAIVCGERAIEAARERDDMATVAESLVCIGRAHRALGQLDAARAAWQQVSTVLSAPTHVIVTQAAELLAAIDEASTIAASEVRGVAEPAP